jgi:prepilin-type processing-associated H-X9-DG protein
MLVPVDPVTDVVPATTAVDRPGFPSPKPNRGWRLTKWVVGIGVLIGLFFMLFVPTMCRSSEAANRIKCSSNLRQLGLAMKLFADSHDGRLPANWRELAENSEITADVFICPSGPDTRAFGDEAKTWTATLDDPAAHHSSYFYAGHGLQLASLTDQDIVAFELDADHSNDGVNLLFADGHVDWQFTRLDSQPAFERLKADHAAGVRPLRWKPD